MISIDPPEVETRRLWEKLAELATQLGVDREWCLIGGLMVQLHAYEHGEDSRPTDDIDLLGNSRSRPSMTERIAEVLNDAGATLATPSSTDPSLGYRFEIDGETVEVLGPDGLKRDPSTLGNFETIQVPGGTQALRRTEKVSISVAGGPETEIRRPTLLGAILLKARATVRVRGRFEEHREDLVRLLGFVHDPRAEAADGRLTANERKWLQAVDADVRLDDPVLHSAFSDRQLERARQAFELLAR